MNILPLVTFVWNHPLNAPNRIAALSRVARWQVASRLLSSPIALPFVEGTSLLTAKGMTGATGNWDRGLQEVGDMGFVLHLLRPGDHFVDVGANVGSYTVLAAGAAGARVTCVEPIPETFENLKRNIAFNGLSATVDAWQGGLSDAPGRLRFTNHLDAVNHVLADGEIAETIEVPVRTLDDLVGTNSPVLIKIDVEGHERAVLLGAQETLANPGLLAVVLETNDSGARHGVADHQLVGLMRAHGFCAHGYDPFERKLLGAPPAGGNTVFIRDITAVAARLRDSKRYRLINGTI